MNAMSCRELVLRQVIDPFQIPPVAQLQGKTRRTTCKAGLGVEFRKRRFDRRDVAAMTIEEEDFFKAVGSQRTRPVTDGGDERRRPERDRSRETQMMLGHADIEGRGNQDIR
ncbi:hypothetical protein D3C87_1608640 [compost metagenome]